MKERELELREKSGVVSTSDPLAAFFYLLVKDYLQPDKVESIFEKLKEVVPGSIVFNNGWLGKYALNLKEQIEELRNLNDPVKELDAVVVSESEKNTDKMLKQVESRLGKDEAERIKKDIQEFKQECELDELFNDIMVEE